MHLQKPAKQTPLTCHVITVGSRHLAEALDEARGKSLEWNWEQSTVWDTQLSTDANRTTRFV